MLTARHLSLLVVVCVLLCSCDNQSSSKNEDTGSADLAYLINDSYAPFVYQYIVNEYNDPVEYWKPVPRVKEITIRTDDPRYFAFHRLLGFALKLSYRSGTSRGFMGLYPNETFPEVSQDVGMLVQKQRNRIVRIALCPPYMVSVEVDGQYVARGLSPYMGSIVGMLSCPHESKYDNNHDVQ